MKKVLSLLCMLMTVGITYAQTTFKIGDFYYQIVSVPNKTVRIVKGDTPYKGHIDIPSTIEYSGRVFKVISIKAAFFRNEDITSVHIPSSLEKVEYEAFDQCKNLSHIQIDEGIKEIDESAFRKTSVTYVKLPQSVKTLGYHCFAGCARLRNIDMPGVETISLGVFNACNLLVDLEFPSTLKVINGIGGMAGCSSLRTITFNSPVLWRDKVENCPSLVQIVSNTSTPKACSPFLYGNMDTKTTIVVPKGAVSAYTSTSGWNSFLNIKEIEGGTVTLPTIAEALNKLGDNYYEGKEDHVINYKKANECYRKAMEMGDAEGYFNWGYSLEFGLGTNVDLQEAERMYQEALSKNFDYERVRKHLTRIHEDVKPTRTEEITTQSRRINIVSYQPNEEAKLCKIKWVECKGRLMTIHGVFENDGKSKAIWWEKTLHIIAKDGQKRTIIEAQGIPLAPKSTFPAINEYEKKTFTITFTTPPAGTIQFDMIESDKADAWKWLNIKLEDPI